MWEEIGLSRATFATINGENMRIKELPRDTFNYHEIEEMKREGVASNHPLL
jgi:hypothetical protein